MNDEATWNISNTDTPNSLRGTINTITVDTSLTLDSTGTATTVTIVPGSAVNTFNSGAITIDGGTLTIGRDSSSYGSATINATGDVTINGGKLIINEDVPNDTKATLNATGDLKVTGTGTVDTSGGGVLKVQNATFDNDTISTSTITGMFARAVTVRDKAIVNQGADLTIDGVGSGAVGGGAANTYASLTVSGGGEYRATANTITLSNTGGNTAILNLVDGGTVTAGGVTLNGTAPGNATLNVTGGTATPTLTTPTNTIVGALAVANGTVNLGTAKVPGYLEVKGNVTLGAGSVLNTFAAHDVLKGTVGSSIDTVVGAKLNITGGKTGTYKLTTGFDDTTTPTQAGWLGNDLTVADPFMAATGVWNAAGASNAHNYTLTLAYRDMAPFFPAMRGATVGMVNAMLQQKGLDVDSADPSQRFVSRALSNGYLGTSQHRQAAATVEGAAQMATVGAAQGATLSAHNAGAGTIVARTSIANPIGDVRGGAVNYDEGGVSQRGISGGSETDDGLKNGFALWLMPLYRGENVRGMKAGNFKTGYTSGLGGLALGADYTVEKTVRFGLALNMGAGNAESTGDFNKTDNKFDFWGLTGYLGWMHEDFGLTADVGYTSTHSTMTQKLPASMAFGNLKADVDAHILSAGLRSEYRIGTDDVDIIPHLGARYSGMTTDAYSVKGGGGTVFKADESRQTLWTFPVGVTLSKDVALIGGWTFRPLLDLGAVPATGDVQATNRVRMPGVNSSAEMKTQVVDYLTFDGTAGFEVKNNVVSLGLNYNNQTSEHRTAHGIQGTLRYEF